MQENLAALERWETRLRIGGSGQAFVRLADLLLAEGRADEALEILEQGVADGHAGPGALLQLGRLLFRRGRDLEARSHLLRLLGDDPGNRLALAELAERAAVGKRWDEASRYFQRLSELDPVNPTWKRKLREVRAASAEGSAAAGLGSGAGYRPLPTMTLVDIYLAQGYRDKALTALAEMAEADPGRSDVRERIREIEGGLSAHPPGRPGAFEPVSESTGSCGESGSTDLDRVRREAAERRAEEKQMFRSWVHNLRRGRDPE